MNNLQKLRKAIESDNLTEKLIEALLSRQKRFKKGYYRISRNHIADKCARRVSAWYPGKGRLSSFVEKTLGDFSQYSDRIDASDQEQILASAERCLRREFDLLGSGPVVLKTLDWHTDFKNGYRWDPGRFYTDYRQVDIDNNSDVKIPRELSRSHHFLILGQAYLITRDEKYTKEFLDQITGWIDGNPLMNSINWGCTMDVAIRAVNWVWSLGMFFDSKLLDDSVLRKIYTSLYEHGFFIYRNPEKYQANNHNHYIADLVGQIYLGAFLKGLPESSVWLSKGASELFREMRSQILPSGPTYERSTNYHRLVLELLSSAIILLRKEGAEIPSDVWYRLEKMYQFVMYYTQPDGMAPVIGDQDDGRAHVFSLQESTDHRYLLSVAAVLFDKADFKAASSGYNADCFFLLGADSCDAFRQIEEIKVELGSRRFPDAGFFVMRKGNNYMFINSSGKGRYPDVSGGTHTHSDLLSFVLAVNGKTFLIDPGTYLYSANPQQRKYFRSTQMHNTITVDGESQNVLDEECLWDFDRNAIPRLYSWKSDPLADKFSGGHSGYQRLADPVDHRRKIEFFKNPVQWVIEDCLTGQGKHFVEATFHFDENIDFDVVGSSVTTKDSDGNNICLRFESATPFNLEKRTNWVSKRYGTRVEAKELAVKFDARLPIQLKTYIEGIVR